VAGILEMFRAIWAVDFEFNFFGDPGGTPRVVCMAARELRSGREIRLWGDELIKLARAPFDVGSESLVIAFYNSAEFGCFLELGWPLPVNTIDLFVEHRVETNGRKMPCGNKLPGALAYRGLAHIDAGDKQAMIDLILSKPLEQFTEEERQQILSYCASDVEGLAALWPVMAPSIDVPRALLRGRYMIAAARMERVGIPVDVELHQRLVQNWGRIKELLIVAVDRDFGVFDGTTFKRNWFARYLIENGIPWPRLATGALALDEKTFERETRNHPRLRPLYELRVSLGRMRLTGLRVGADGRARCMLSAFQSKTGRNQPSASGFLFGPARWIRGLAREREGRAIAYLDFSAQEVAVAAGLSSDARLIEDYETDPHLEFAKAVGLLPQELTAGDELSPKQATIRNQCKQAVLGMGYGMTEYGLAIKAEVSRMEARELLRLHKQTYRRFWEWSDSIVTTALFRGEMSTSFGWHMHVGSEVNARSLMNWPMQSHGAEMLRIAAIAATEAGLEVCCPVHDAFLISAPIERIDADVEKMRAIMKKAGRVVAGIDVRVDAKIVKAPDRYKDKRGVEMWDLVIGLLERIEREGGGAVAEATIPSQGADEWGADELASSPF
jgi:DNA polymerase-1